MHQKNGVSIDHRLEKTPGFTIWKSNCLGIYRLMGKVSESETDGLVSGYETDWVNVRMVVSQNFKNCENLGKQLLYPIWRTPVFFRDDVYLTCSQKNVPTSAQNNALKRICQTKKRINTQKGLKISI